MANLNREVPTVSGTALPTHLLILKWFIPDTMPQRGNQSVDWQPISQSAGCGMVEGVQPQWNIFHRENNVDKGLNKQCC